MATVYNKDFLGHQPCQREIDAFSVRRQTPLHQSLMMETEEVSDTLATNSILTRMMARHDSFQTFTSTQYRNIHYVMRSSTYLSRLNNVVPRHRGKFVLICSADYVHYLFIDIRYCNCYIISKFVSTICLGPKLLGQMHRI
jgi:hypothetical protein